MKQEVFTSKEKFKVYYYKNSNVFKPTRTTSLIIKAINENKKKFKKNSSILDLGCGSGIIGIAIKKKIFKNSDICFSDSSNTAIKITKKNLKLNKLHCETKKSYLMQKWKNKEFDLIVNDVSGISSFFLRKNFWYNKFIPCDSGLDGTKLTFKFFKNFKRKNISIIIPLISLSNVIKVKSYFVKKKIKFQTLLKEDWPLPKNLVDNYLKDLINLKRKGLIFYKERFGMLLASTEILLVRL